jgi:hypothetical protein
MAADVQPPAIDEEQYYHDAQLGAIWSASRTLIPVVAALYGGIYFAYFYLRSLNSNNLWDPHHITASKIIGFSIMVLGVVAALVQVFVNRRLRRGFTNDFIVGSAFNTLLLLIATGLQVWTLTRLPFPPGYSGYSGVYIAFGPVNAVVLGLTAFWLFTLMMRAIRSYGFYKPDGGIGLSAYRNAENFRASLDGYSAFVIFMALIGIFSWYLYFVLA